MFSKTSFIKTSVAITIATSVIFLLNFFGVIDMRNAFIPEDSSQAGMTKISYLESRVSNNNLRPTIPEIDSYQILPPKKDSGPAQGGMTTDNSVLNTQNSILVSAWLANWDLTSGLNKYKQNPSLYNSLSPTWYYPNSDGALLTKTTARDTTTVYLLKTNNTKLIPTVGLNDASVLTQILNDQSKQTRLIDEMVNEVINYGYAGIDIDFEGIKADDRDQFSIFIKELSEKLHSNNKLLTIAILPKTSSLLDVIVINGVGGAESRNAQDWEEIGKHVDEFRIMGYDYTHSYNLPGPIAPYDWLEDILKYATSKIDKNKVVLGLPTYAYRWRQEQKGADALVLSQVNEIKSKYKVISDELDSSKNEKHMIYEKEGITYEVWYQDDEVNSLRFNLAERYEIKGVIYWRL